jgi:integrase
VPRKIPNLVLKKGRYYFRMRVPTALVEMYEKTEVSLPLGDVSWSQAASLARKLTAEWDDKFERDKHAAGVTPNAPAPMPGKVVRTPTIDEVRDIARASARQRLADDEEMRIQGLRSDGGEWWVGRMLDMDNALERMLAEGDARELWQDFRVELNAHGLAEPADRSDARRLLHAWAMEHAKGMQDIKRRMQGVPVETPPAVQAGPAKRMQDAYKAWQDAAKRPEKTVGAFGRHVAMFAEMMGDPPLHTLKRGDGLRFRDKLQEWAVREGRTADTANNVLASIKAITNVARDREWLEVSPFEKMEVSQGGKESEGREPWTHDELEVLFDSPLFKAYELPEGDSIATKGGRDAAYWVPLLAAYSGARPGELCQLWVDDVSEQEDGLVMEFRSDGKRGQKLKNKGSWRAVPVHSELVRLGFHEYLHAMKRKGEGRLFPHIPSEGQNGAAGQYGHWFGEYKRERGFTSSAKTLHSFRHTVISELVFAGVEEAIRHAITGHEGSTVHEKVYAATVRRHAARLRPHVEKISYPKLTLPRVYEVK